MPELSFIALDPKVKLQSASIRKAVRSQAAKSAVPQRKKQHSRVKQRAKAEAFLAEHSNALAVSATDRDANAAWHHPESDGRQLSVCALQQTPESGLTSPLPSSDSYPSSQMSDRTTSSGDSNLKLAVEPTHPLLLLQPLLTKPFSPLLQTYYLSSMAVDIPDLDWGNPGSLRTAWYPFVLMNDGLLHVIFLLAGCSFANSRFIADGQMASIRSCLIELKAHAYQHMRRMISDQDNFSTDETIGAVVKMASYESMFGSPENHHLHMSALKKLIAARGGIQKLGLNGLLGRMVLWVDYQAACLLNTPMHFVEEASGLPKPMEFGPSSFVGSGEC